MLFAKLVEEGLEFSSKNGDIKVACVVCIKGHRTYKCNIEHWKERREFLPIKGKGRPRIQCDDCRAKRKMDKKHKKCVHNGSHDSEQSSTNSMTNNAGVAEDVLSETFDQMLERLFQSCNHITNDDQSVLLHEIDSECEHHKDNSITYSGSSDCTSSSSGTPSPASHNSEKNSPIFTPNDEGTAEDVPSETTDQMIDRLFQSFKDIPSDDQPLSRQENDIDCELYEKVPIPHSSTPQQLSEVFKVLPNNHIIGHADEIDNDIPSNDPPSNDDSRCCFSSQMDEDLRDCTFEDTMGNF